MTVNANWRLTFEWRAGDDALAGLWLRMQAAYSLWQASERVALDDIPVRATP